MHALLAVTGGPSWALLLVAASVGGLLWWSQRNARRAAGLPRRPAPPNPAPSGEVLPSEEWRRWEVEMHELARSLTGEINTRIAILQQLLRAAERESARLESLLARPPASDASPPLAGPHRSARTQREAILAWAQREAAADEITAATGAPPGEVELVLGLLRAGPER